MSRKWMPEDYSTISPYLVVPDGQAVIDFMKDAFGGRQLRRYDAPDGSLRHAEVRIGNSVVMLGQANEHVPAVHAHVHLYVEDVDTVFRRAVETGGNPVQEPKEQEGDPDRRGGVRDPGGNTWWISTQVHA